MTIKPSSKDRSEKHTHFVWRTIMNAVAHVKMILRGWLTANVHRNDGMLCHPAG